MAQSSTWSDLARGAWPMLVDELRAPIAAAASLEDAAQLVTDALVAAVPETPLARIYVVLPKRELPPEVQTFVEGIAGSVEPATPVLSLLGSSGAKPDWHGRKTSRGHRGIPLASSTFVEAIPMLAALLKELGIELDWLDAPPEGTTRRLVGGFNGVFYVEDARTMRDAKGRLVIPAVDFVEEQRVRTVFGMGGFYPDGTMVVAIVFTREELARAEVDRFASLITMLKGQTFAAVRRRAFFRP